MEHETDIVLLGGGIAAGVLALSLAQSGLSSCMIAPLKTARVVSAPQAYALTPASVQILRALGLWEELGPRAVPIEQMIVTIGDEGCGPSPARLHFECAELESGALAYMIEDALLRPAVAHAVGGFDKLIRPIEAKAIGFEEDKGGVRVELEGGQAILAALSVIADGRGKKYAQMAGFCYFEKDYHQDAITARIGHEYPHNGIAHQIFTPLGPLAILPMEGRHCAIVWSLPSARARKLNGVADAEFIRALRPLFGDFRGEISLTSGRGCFPLKLMQPDQLTKGRVALIGDAAHNLHPLAGQGLNLGLCDAVTLAEVLSVAARRGEDIGASDVLERFARWRRSDIASITALTDGLNRLLSSDSKLHKVCALSGMMVLNESRTFMQALTRAASGVSGDIPRVLRGKSI